MTAVRMAKAERAIAPASHQILRLYYLAMAVPFVIDLITSTVYATVHARFAVLLPMVAVAAGFLLVGLGVGAHLLIRPVKRFLEGRTTFTDIQDRLARLPRHSAILVAVLFAPMMALRLLSPRFGITFGATIDIPGWIDTVATFFVLTSFNVVLVFFVVSAYLDGLCAHLFETRGVNLDRFRGSFSRKVGVGVLFVAFAALTLLAGDIASYEGERLIKEASVDVVGSFVGAIIVYLWISRALTGAIVRLDHGMKRVAEGDLDIRLPVTSDDEVGRATSGFNQMVTGLSERQYLRDTFGKYLHESVAADILENQERRGRAADRLADATLMFTDIEGFTGLSESVTPAEVARILNTYYGTIVPVIHRHRGVVNNCIGDGLFASFNLPLALPDHAAAALRAALEIQAALADATFAPGMRIRTRIGINTGPVIGVTIGTSAWLSYTLLGDAVNIASRVEQLNKRFQTQILATESTVRAAGDGFSFHRLGEIGVRGHQGEVVVYSLAPPS